MNPFIDKLIIFALFFSHKQQQTVHDTHYLPFSSLTIFSLTEKIQDFEYFTFTKLFIISKIKAARTKSSKNN